MDLLSSPSNYTEDYYDPAGSSSSEAVLGLDNYGADLDAELFRGYPAWLLELAACCCWVFALVGIPGNLITIAALARCKKVRNATAVFIMNLSLSDLLFCCFNLPLAASTFRQRAWRHGAALCGLFPLLRYGLLAVSLLSVLAITVNRYVMIGHPRLYPRLYRNRNLGWMLASIWVFGFGALVPTLCGGWGRFGLDPKVGSCTILPGEDGHSPKEFLFVVAFVIPCVSIAVCYARIYYIVRRTAERSRGGAGLNAAGGAAIPLPIAPPQDNNHKQALANEMIPLKNADRSSAYESDAGDHCAVYPASPATNGGGEDGDVGGQRANYNTTANGVEGWTTSGACEMKPLNNAIGTVSSSRTEIAVPDPHLLSPHAAPPHHGAGSDVTREPESSSGIESSAEQDDNNHTGNNHHHQQQHSGEDPGLPPSYRKGNKVGYGSPRSERSFGSAQAVIRRSKRYRRPGAPERRSVITTSTTSLGHPGRMSTKDKKLLWMILVIFVSFLICYLPITVTKIFQMTSKYRVLNISGYLLIYLTTCINPIIYVVMSSEYRQAYKNLLTCQGCRRDSLPRGNTTRRGTLKA